MTEQQQPESAGTQGGHQLGGQPTGMPNMPNADRQDDSGGPANGMYL